VEAASQAQTADGHQLHVFYAKNVVGGADTFTATFSSANNHPWIAIYEVRNASTTNPLDQAAHAQGSGSVANSGATPLTTSANEFVFAVTGLPASYTGTVTAGAGYTLEIQDTGHSRAATEWENVSATGSYSGIFNLSPGTNWTAIVVTFKP
jgi:hypothetical protein